MAVQFGVAYSSVVKGAGIVAGGPYYCAQGDVDIATTKCSCTGFGIGFLSSCEVAPGATDVGRLAQLTNQLAREDLVDPVSHLATQRIWLFSGTLDSTVPPPVMADLHAYYRHFVPADRIRFRNDVPAQHAMPTESYGNACDKLGSPYINDCNLDAAGEILKWIYGSLKPKNTGAPSGKLIEFDQSEFVEDLKPEEHGLAATGFVYVPATCEGADRRPCRLHIAFHGCKQNYASIGDRFIRHAGYNAWADANDFIVLYPQTVAIFGRNPNACWDWFDFNGDNPDYANKNGIQTSAVMAMAERIAGLSKPPDYSRACFTTTNVEHVLAGRAHDSFFLALANGSNDFMGFDNTFTVTTLKQQGGNFYVIGSCH